MGARGAQRIRRAFDAWGTRRLPWNQPAGRPRLLVWRPREVWTRLIQLSARIGVRLLAFNLLLVFVPIGGVLYLDTYEKHLLEAQERGMIQQGRMLAAVLADSLEGQGAPLDRARVGLALQRLDRRTDARLRIVDSQGQLLGDSSVGGPEAPAESDGHYAPSRSDSTQSGPPRSDPAQSGPTRSDYDVTQASTRERLRYRLGVFIVYVKRRLLMPRQPFGARTEAGEAPALAERTEVKAALAGRYGAATRLTGGQRSLTLYSAIPIRRDDQVLGAVIVSQSTYRLLQALYDVRLEAFNVVLGSALVAIALSAILTATIARPLAQLRSEANALVDRRRGTSGRFTATDRRDEIGDLARALQTMTDRLSEHVRFVDTFATDVSHELKNPIAAVRTVAEMLASVDDPHERARFSAMLTREVERLDRLVTGLREVVLVDAQLDREPTLAVEIGALLTNIAEAQRLEQGADGVRVLVKVDADQPIHVRASPDRLAQVFSNLVDNAVSFSPAGGTVRLTMAQDGSGQCLVRVEDDGEGIPETHLARIFDRFFSYRPSAASPHHRHTGLGLAIAKAIVEGYGGSITAANRAPQGARFDVRLPIA